MPEKYHYKCTDQGDVRCDFEYAAEDMAEVREKAAEHRMVVHEIEDTNPAIVDGLIEMQRLEA